MDMLYPWLMPKENSALLDFESKFIHHFSRQIKLSQSMLIGQPCQAELISECQAEHRYLLCNSIPNVHINQVAFCLSNFDELPLNEDSIDLLILAHCLEQHEHPYELLLECAKTVAPEGYLIIFSLNAHSTMHLKHKKNTEIKHWLSPKQTRQWLNNLSYEILSSENFLSPCTMLTQANMLKKTADRILRVTLPILCNAHVIIAKKKALNPIAITRKCMEREHLLKSAKTIKGVARTSHSNYPNQ